MGPVASRLGLLGGTFDPPHYGHLVMAQEAAFQLALDAVLFLPARQNPLKAGEPISSVDDRVRMVELAIGDNPMFRLSRADLDRPPPSYTVELLQQLREEHSEAALFFLLGSDAARELPNWHETPRLLDLATFVVVSRPGAPSPAETVAALTRSLPSSRGRIVGVDAPGVDVSATMLRERFACGKPVTYLLPPPVEAYVRDRSLYKMTRAAGS